MTSDRRRRLGRLLLGVLLSGVFLLVAAWVVAAALFWLDPRPLPVPVDGVSAAGVRSTFGAPRDGGRRRHRGVDLFAPRGTPVRSPGWGVVVFRGRLRLGGNAVATLGHRGALCYYAHLDDWAAGLHVGQVVEPGAVLGTVGNTGNARTTAPHLHFEVHPLAAGLRAVDPAPLLRRPGHASAPRTRSVRSRAEREETVAGATASRRRPARAR